MSKFVPLPRSFYQLPADLLAPKLLGHWLLRDTPQGRSGGPIVEVEAYMSEDPASHSFVGKTERNKAMWGPPGHSYVYLIYGYHFCFNAVCAPEGMGEAVLVRALEPQFGEAFMHQQRPVADLKHLTSGPAKLCAALAIDRSLDGVDLCDAASPLVIAENPDLKKFLKECGPMVTTTRVGITRAADKPWRFYLDGSPFVSRRIPRAKKTLPIVK
jgi:DNA-3-methyladenine glycosylase